MSVTTEVHKFCALQTAPVFGEKQKNTDRSLLLIREAAEQGAVLIALPELCSTGYVFHSRRELYDLAEPIPDGPTVRAWEKLARELGVYIAAGIAELAPDRVRCYNSAVLLGPDGYIGHYRKLHLWGEEKLFFEPGDGGCPVFHTPIGRIGLLICYDMWFPEAFRLLALKGADVICCSSNWLDHTPVDPSTMGIIQAMAGASSNHVFVVASSRIGVERGVRFAGKSLIAGTNGQLLAGPLDPAREGMVMAEVPLATARQLNIGPLNVTLRDRRTDVYDLMLGSRDSAFPR